MDSDDWAEVDRFTDATGKTVSIGHAGDLVRLAVSCGSGLVLWQVVLDGERRDEFMRAFAEAERRAEAVPA